MTWHGRLARAGVVAVLAACGCAARPANLSALPPGTEAMVRDAAEVARSQKPDVAAARSNLSAVCLISPSAKPPAEAANAKPTASILAVVNGEPILEEEVMSSCYQQYAGARTPQERAAVLKQALEQLIDREILLQDAIAKLERGGPQGAKFIEKIKEVADKEFEKRWLLPLMKQNKMTDREEFSLFMRQHGMSVDVTRRWFQRNFMAMEYLRSRIEPHMSRVGHTEIIDYYNSHSEEYTQPDSVHWQDIFIDATKHASPADGRRFADSLVQRVRQGEDFAKLSAEFDDGTSGRFRKGDGQGCKRGEIHPTEAEPVLFGMRDGDIRIVERSRGLHIVRLVKRDYAGPIPFDEKVQKEIKDKLRTVIFQREMLGIVKELKRKAVIDPPVR